MKIAVLAHLKFPIAAPFSGGLERQTHLLVGGLRRRGHEVSVYAAEGTDPALSPIVMGAPTGALTGELARDAAIENAEETAYGRMMELVAAGGYDIVHANCLHDRPLRDAARIGPPMLTVLHVPRYEPFATSLRSASHVEVVAVSRQLAEIWRDVVPRIAIVPNGIDLETFSPGPAPAAGSPYGIWSGRVSPEKGLHLAIDAARLAGLDIAFAGPRRDDAYWRGEIAPRLGSGVHDLGHLGEVELVRWLRGARVAIVSPLWEEPFGLVVPEALACGTPVAAFARGAVPDLVSAETGRLAMPGDAADLARAIQQAGKLDRTSCRADAARWGLDRMLDAYEALYAGMRDRATRTGARITARLPLSG